MHIIDLRCEYMNQPIGIGEQSPRFSWIMEASQKGMMQQAYQLDISKDAQLNSIEYSTGKIMSDRSTHVECAGFTAKSRERYYYRVKVWDQYGEESPWSESSYWEMGLLNPQEQNAAWISPPLSIVPTNSSAAPLLRKTFSVEKQISKARIYATALGIYELEINGNRVGSAYFTPGWTSYQHRIQVQTYDVTQEIKPGHNVIGSWLGNGWYKGYLGWKDQQHIYGDRLALWMQLHIQYEDGSEELIESDSSWKCALGPITMSELYHGESYDATLYPEGWQLADYDASTWLSVDQLDAPPAELVPQVNEAVTKHEHIVPIDSFTTPKGEQVIDFGQNLVGFITIRLNGKHGQQVIIDHAEVLDSDGNFYTENLRSAKQQLIYTCSGKGNETYEPKFTFQGFRYIRVQGLEAPLQLEDFSAYALHSEMEEKGHFACSDPLINQLQQNIRWGLKGNFLDVPTDCPQRDERLGWTGDAQMFIRTATFLYEVGPFFEKWLGDLQLEQRSDGAVPFVIPHVLSEDQYASAAWGDAAVICPWTIYITSGDARILSRQYESMRGWIDYITQQGDDPYLWNTGFHFGDWLGLDAKYGDYVGATEKDLIASAYYVYSLRLFVKTTAILGKDEDNKRYSDLLERVLQAFQAEFISPSGRLGAETQTAHVLALYFDLVEGESRERSAAKLNQLVEQNDYHLTTGFVGTPYLNFALSQNGYLDTAYLLLFQREFPSWLYPVTQGATTMWEHWDGIKPDGSLWSSNMNSFNHYAYGAIGDWLYQEVAGVQIVEEQPGYKHFRIAPQLTEQLSWAEAKLTTLYGLIRSYWQQEEQQFITIEVTVPVNTTAQLVIPANRIELSRFSQLASAAAGLKAVDSGILDYEEKDKQHMWTLGSGQYRFSAVKK